MALFYAAKMSSTFMRQPGTAGSITVIHTRVVRRSHGPIFDDQTRYLAKIPRVARDQDEVVRQCNRGNFLISGTGTQTHASK
jgi:hypothetical protein